MKRFKYSIYCMCGALALCMVTASCSDESEELTEVSYDRLFSPVDLEVRVRQQVNAAISWNDVDKAEGYTLELYLGESSETGVLTQTENTTATSFLFSKLEGAETYAVRVKAVGASVPESKWTETSFKTDAEQLFYEVDLSLVEAKQVTLMWPAGENVQTLTLEPGGITHTLTAEEIASGTAVITGLTPETAYTATLWKGTKSRGSVTFETLIDLDGANPVYPGDDFVKMLSEAEEGTSFAFFPGVYKAKSEAEGAMAPIIVEKSIEIKAVRPDDRPVINANFQLKPGTSLSLKQVVIDGNGTGGSGCQAFEYTEEGTYGTLTIEDCEIHHFVKGFYYVNVAAEIEAIRINNCLIHDITCSGGDMFDCRKGYIKELNITNSTIWNSCAARDFVRYDDASGSFAGAKPMITIDRCTIDGVSDNSGRRLFYVRFKGNSIVFTNNLISNMPSCGRGFSDNSNTGIPSFDNNNYYNTANLVSNDGGSGKFYDTEGKTLNPNYKDADNGDFTVSNEDILYYKMGDPRWLK